MSFRRDVANRLLPRGRFIRGVALLAGGTAIAQLLSVAGAPVLTRLFRPADFGVLAVYGSLVAMLLPISALRYDLAIPLPEGDEPAANLLVLALGITVLFTSLAGTAGILLDRQVALALGAPALGRYLWLLPLSLAGASAYSAFSYWAVRKGTFASIARSRLGQSIGQLSTQLGLGSTITGPFGLLAGDVVGRVVGSGTLAALATRDRDLFRDISWRGLRDTARRYARFPLLSTPSALLNAAGLNIPTLILATFFGAEVVGWFALAQRIIGIPMTLISQAVSQVYLSEAARLARNDPKSLLQLFRRTSGRLFMLGALPAILLCSVGPWLFAGIFGSSWRMAGEYLRLLAPMFLVQFAVVPVSMTATILERQDVQLAWDMGRFVIVVGCMIFAGARMASALAVILIYSAAMLVAYLVLWSVLGYIVRRRMTEPGPSEPSQDYGTSPQPAPQLSAES